MILMYLTGLNYTNNCMPTVIDIYNRGFVETTFEGNII